MKVVPLLTVEEAVAKVPDGATVLIGGFGLTGNPVHLIHALAASDVQNLTTVSNNIGEPGLGIGRLVDEGKVTAAIGSYFTSNKVAVQRYLDGNLGVTLFPQGTLVEAIRAGGAGVGGFYTPTGVGTDITEGHETREIDGKEFVFVKSIRGDVALIRAQKADRSGNLVFARTDRNYNPPMATAADLVIVEVEEIVETGEIDGDEIHLPGVYVDYLVEGKLVPEHLGSSASVGGTGSNVDPTRSMIAARALAELETGDVVNLGVGIPTLIADMVTPEHGLNLHTENGMLGVGPAPESGGAMTYPVNAAKQPITALPGASYFDSASSFGLIRGGHLDVAVLGGLQVSQDGSLANWAVPGRPVLGVGGAMDLASGAKRLIVTMTHVAKNGDSKVVPELTLPATVFQKVDTLVTDLAVFKMRDGKLTLVETLGDATLEDVKNKTTAEFEIDL